MGVNDIHCFSWILTLNGIHRQWVYLLCVGVSNWFGSRGGKISSGLVALGEPVAVVGLA